MRLQENEVKLNREKLKLCQTTVKFYGHVLTNEGLKPDESKVETIKNYPVPTNRKELHRFIGMVNYLGRFLPNLSENFSVLRKLISEKEQWIWSSEQEEEFNRVKALVSDVNTLRYYDATEPLIVECDASCFGLGVAVFQRKGVIGYASRTLTKTERNYAQIEKEMLAILFACVKFDQLIVGNPMVTVKTDHKPLVNIFRKPLLSAPRRLQHMLLNLQRYNLRIEFVTGKDNVVADAISRAPLPECPEEDCYRKANICEVFRNIEEMQLSSFLNISEDNIQEIIDETTKDFTFQKILLFVRNGWPKSVHQVPEGVKIYFKYRYELSTQDGLLFRNDRIVIPYSLRKEITRKAHVSHNGVEATLKLARANVFWPGMSAQIREAVKECTVCAKYAPSQAPAPMQTHPIPVHPFQIVSMDVFFAEYRGEKRKFLITVDHYSDFFEVDLLKDLTPRSSIAVCKTNFSRHGRPQVVVTDNGTNFTSREWKQFASDWDFRHSTSAPNHQQANGKAEAAVKIAKHLLKKCAESGTDFWYALLHWRNIPNRIGSSPVQRLFSRNTKSGLPTSVKNLMPCVVEDVPESIELNKKKSKYQYDKKAKHLPDLDIGAPVYVQLNPDSCKQWTPAVVAHRPSDRSYVVNVDGASYRRDRSHLKLRNEPHTPSTTCQPPLTRQNSLEIPDTDVSRDTPADPVTSIPVSEEIAPNPVTPKFYTPVNDTEHLVLQRTPIQSSPKITDVASGSQLCTPRRPRRDTKVPSKFKDYLLDFD